MQQKSIHEQEEAIFNEWIEHDNILFCKDGLHYSGIASKEDGYWNMDYPDGKEELNWFGSPIRCLFLTKDHNLQGDKQGVDVREETGYNNDTDTVYYQFYARYLQLLYGLMHIDINTFAYPSLEECQNTDTYLGYFHKAPVVRINTKKIAGGSSCNVATLAKYLNRDAEQIKKQIAIYNANIIVVCQDCMWDLTSNHDNICYIMDLINQQYPDMKKWREDNGFIYYSDSTKTIILHEWHVGARVSYQDFYEGVRYVSEFLKEHPNYLRKPTCNKNICE